MNKFNRNIDVELYLLNEGKDLTTEDKNFLRVLHTMGVHYLTKVGEYEQVLPVELTLKEIQGYTADTYSKEFNKFYYAQGNLKDSINYNLEINWVVLHYINTIKDANLPFLNTPQTIASLEQIAKPYIHKPRINVRKVERGIPIDDLLHYQLEPKKVQREQLGSKFIKILNSHTAGIGTFLIESEVEELIEKNLDEDDKESIISIDLNESNKYNIIELLTRNFRMAFTAMEILRKAVDLSSRVTPSEFAINVNKGAHNLMHEVTNNY